MKSFTTAKFSGLLAILILGATLNASAASLKKIVPIVGSAPGANGAAFRTELQLHNGSARRIAGALVYHPAGRPAGSGDPQRRYDLAPFETISFEDIVAELGQTGIGSLDIIGDDGNALPTAMVRAYNLREDGGTLGSTVPVLSPEDAMSPGETAALIVPADLVRYRLNIGIRTLDEPVTLIARVFGADGIQRGAGIRLSYAGNFFNQQTAGDFLGTGVQPNDSIFFEIESGRAFIYGATTDNRTNDPNIQVDRLFRRGNSGAESQSVSTDEDVAIDITLTSRSQGHRPFTFSISRAPLHGTLSGLTPVGDNQARVTYTPFPDYNGPDSFVFELVDSRGNRSTAIVAITVRPVNDAPRANAQTVSTNEDTAVTITLSGTDVEGQSLTFSIATPPANGSLGPITQLTPTTASVVYAPNAGFNGTDSFQFTVSDGTLSGTATVTINVLAVDNQPSAGNDSYTVNEDGTLNVPTPGVLANDTDPEGQTLLAVQGTGPSNGSLTLNANGSFTYIPNPNFFGTDFFTYSASDGSTQSAPATVTITVTGINDVPSFTAGASQIVLEDSGANTLTGWATGVTAGPLEGAQMLTFNVTANSNPTLFSTGPTVAADGTLRFTPAPNANGSASITINLQDNGGTANGGVDTSATQTFTITVTAVNDVPVFTAGGAQTVNEDSGAQSVPNFATGISAGPADESGQTLNFLTSNDNNTLFSAQPSIAPDGTLSYTPAPNAFGSSTVTVRLQDNGGTANGGVDTTTTQTFVINVTAVNDVPVFTSGGPVTVNEDAGALSMLWATGVSAGPNEAAQTLTFSVSNDNNGLFSVQPAVDPAGVLTFTLAPNANGSANVSVTLSDNGGTANGGVDTSAAQAFLLTVNAVNDAPSFTVGATQTVNEDSAAQTAANFISVFSPGPADESAQTLTFLVSNDNTALFAAQPSIAPNGTLTYTPAANAFGSATVTVSVQDNGGTANGGVDTSGTQTFVINVTAVNDEPSFTPGADVTVNEDSAAYSAGWATAISAGANEGAQTLTFSTSNNNDSLFSSQPAISASGTLSFTPAANASGSATVSVFVSDDGGTLNGGDDTSATVTFTITVNPVNDAPTFTSGGDVTVNENSAPYSAAWASAMSPGPADEAAQTLTFSTSNNNNTLFSVQPSVAADGTLSFTLAANANGTATVSVTLQDNGGVANGGVDQTTQTFTLTVNSVNSEPTFTAGGDVTVLEDSGAYSASWASAINQGAGEGSQTVNFVVTNDNNALFSVQPAISATGVLTFTAGANLNGSATVSVTLMDDGGTANGGDNASPTVTFLLTVTGVNDEPSLTSGGNLSVIENSGAYSQTWATGMSAGPSDEAGQTLTFAPTTNTNNGLFSVQPSIASNGLLTFTPAANAFGTATVTVTLSDNGGTANAGDDTFVTTFTINVLEVNSEPSFTPGGNVTVNEDNGAYSAAWASGISAGPGEGTQTLTFSVSNDNNGLFASQPAVAANGTLTFTPAANVSGSTTVSVFLMDNGGTANGGDDTSPTVTFTITVNTVNDAPSFVSGGAVTVNEDSAPYSATWATAISAGPADEIAQTLTFNVSNNNNSLFSSQPAIASDGTLTFTLALNAFGSATVTVTLSDNGGTANGGADTSGATLFTLTVNAVNDEPSFTSGGNVTVNEDSGAFSAAWATAISAGPVNEAGQTLTFNVSNDNNPLFSVQPAISAAGVLSFTPAVNAFGAATVTVFLQDNGGTANSGDDTSATVTFTLTITGINDAPTANTVGPFTTHSAIPISFAAATLGGTDVEVGTTVTVDTAPGAQTNGVVVLNTNGSFTFTANAGVTGVGAASFTYRVCDDGIPAPSQCSAYTTVAFNVNSPAFFFVKSVAVGSGNCTLGNECTLATAVTNIGSATGKTIFISDANSHPAAVPLNVSGNLIGQGATTAFDTLFAIGSVSPGTLAARPPTRGNNPALIAPAITSTVTMNSSTVVRGVAINPTGATALTEAIVASIAGLTVSEVSINATNGAGIILSDVTAASLSFSSVSSSGAASGISFTNVAGSFTSAGSITGSTGNAFNINGGTISVNYAGSIGVTLAGSRPVNIINMTAVGGPIDFTGPVSAANSASGVNLDNNVGTTVTFRGGLDINTGANTAFNAVNGGTIAVCDESPCNPALTGAFVNVLFTTTGTSLNVANTNIGASNLEFRSISAGTGASGPTNGIILNTTGASGGLKVKGNGGSCTPALPTCTGGTIQRTTSFGVVLTNTANVEFNLFSIHDTGDRGINGSGVSNFIYRDSRVFNFDNGAHAPGATVDAMTFTNLTGTVTIQRNTLGPDGQFVLSPFPPLPENKGIIVRNTNVANLAMTVTGSTFTQLSNDGIDAEVTGGTGTVNVDGSTGDGANVFNQINGRGVNFGAPVDNASARVLDLTVRNNTFTSVGIGGRWFAPARTTMNARFNNNTMSGTSNDAIRSEADAADGTLNPKATVNATINGNNMGGGGIFISNHRQAIANIALTNNSGIGFFGINVNSDRGSTIGIDITGNSVSVNGASPNFANAMYLQTSNNGGGASTTCANISGNVLTSTGATSAGVVLDTVNGEGTIGLEGYVSGPEETYLTSVNTITGSPQVAIDNAAFVNPGGNCVTSTP